MFCEILQKFAEKTPIAVMVRGLLERLLNPTKLDSLFEAVCRVQYTKEILFSSIVSLMLQVVCKIRPNVHSAYYHSDIKTSAEAVYKKLKGVETTTSQALVRHIASESALMIHNMNGANPPLLPGYHVKFLDGNCIAATEHRLKVLRDTRAGALPGKSLVVFDPELGIAGDVFPCEDGHTQERALLGEVVETVRANDIWVADRNFCVLEFLFKIHREGAFFVIRQHGNTPYKALSELQFCAGSATGAVFEQPVELISGTGERMTVRRVVVELDNPTRNNDKFLVILTHLPLEAADALSVSEIYRKRWTIETAFQKLEKYLDSEINTLGYPKAALFGFCQALVAFNLYAVVMATLRAAHPDCAVNEEVSDYYVAQEISVISAGMLVIVPEEDWSVFVHADQTEITNILLDLAAKVDLTKFKKHKRGPKKPPTPKTRFIGKPHVSTAKLIASALKARPP
jgi:Transposase DDE domain